MSNVLGGSYKADDEKLLQLNSKVSKSSTWGSSLEGRLLTFIDASFSDRDQREAVKSMIRDIVHDHYSETNLRICRHINEFSDVFEGDAITYTTFNSPVGHADIRKDVEAGLINESGFIRNK